jgi:hypothetical protein
MACCYSCCPADIDEHEDEEDLLCPDPPPGRRILWDYIILDEGHKVRRQVFCTYFFIYLFLSFVELLT